MHFFHIHSSLAFKTFFSSMQNSSGTQLRKFLSAKHKYFLKKDFHSIVADCYTELLLFIYRYTSH